MDDLQIIELYWARSESAIAETAHKYGPYCRSIAWHILHSEEDSEECVNDTYWKAWGAMPPQRPHQLRTFLGKITRNLSLNRYEKNGAEKRGAGQVPLALEECRDDPYFGGYVPSYVPEGIQFEHGTRSYVIEPKTGKLVKTEEIWLDYSSERDPNTASAEVEYSIQLAWAEDYGDCGWAGPMLDRAELSPNSSAPPGETEHPENAARRASASGSMRT